MVSLDDLVASDDQTPDSELAATLHGQITLIEGRDAVRLIGAMKDASARKKLVAAGLARHVMLRKGWIKETGLGAPTEWYSIQVQQKPKSVGEELSRLKKVALIERDDTGWRVPLWALRDALDFLSK